MIPFFNTVLIIEPMLLTALRRSEINGRSRSRSRSRSQKKTKTTTISLIACLYFYLIFYCVYVTRNNINLIRKIAKIFSCIKNKLYYSKNFLFKKS